MAMDGCLLVDDTCMSDHVGPSPAVGGPRNITYQISWGWAPHLLPVGWSSLSRYGSHGSPRQTGEEG